VLTSVYAPVIDPLFKAAGFEVSDGLVQRKIAGRYGGRDCRILIAPRTRTRYPGNVRETVYVGHNLHLSMTVQPRTRCGVFRRETLKPWAMAIKRRLGAKPVESMPASLPHLACWGFEPDWAGGWLGEPSVQDALARLFAPGSGPQASSVSFDPPGRVSLTVEGLLPARIAPERFEDWLADLHRLAQAADAVPAPRHTLSQTALERFVERHPMGAALGLFAAALVILPFVTLLVLGLPFALFVWLVQ
jgi:hypothetical protein